MFSFCFQSISSEGQPKQPKDICTVSVPHSKDQTLSNIACEYGWIPFGCIIFSFMFRASRAHFVLWSAWMWVCVSSTVDGWGRGGLLQSGWWSHTVHWLDPVGGVLPAKPRRVALQTQTSLCPDHPVNPGDPQLHFSGHSQPWRIKILRLINQPKFPATTIVHIVVQVPLLFFFWRKIWIGSR